MSGLFTKGYNSFFLKTTPNQYSINFMNPFHPLVLMKITIDYPLLPNFDEKKWDQVPSYTTADFLSVCEPLEPYLQDENSFLYNAYMLYRDLALENVRYGNIKSEANWRILMSLYIGHHLELHLKDLQDLDKSYTLEKSEKEVIYKVEDLEKLMANEFLRTKYGIRFKNMYEKYASWVFLGHRSQRGRY